MDNFSKITKWLVPSGILFLILGIAWIYAPDIPLFQKRKTSKSVFHPEERKKKTTTKEGREVKEYILGATYVTYNQQPCLGLLKTYEYEYGGILRNDYGITYVNAETGKEIDRRGVELPDNISKHSFFQAKEHFVFYQPTRLSQKESFIMIDARDGTYCRGTECESLKAIVNAEAVSIVGFNNEVLLLMENVGNRWEIHNDSTRFTLKKQEMPKKGKHKWKEKDWVGEDNARQLIETTYESETSGFVTITNGIEDKILIDKYFKLPYTLKENKDFLYFVYEDNQKADPRVLLAMYSFPENKVKWVLWLLDIPEWIKFSNSGGKPNEYSHKSLYKTLHLIDFEKSVVIFTKNFWISATDKSNGKTLWSYDLHKTDTIQ